MQLSSNKGSDPCFTLFHPLLLLHNVVLGFAKGFQDETVTEELHGAPPSLRYGVLLTSARIAASGIETTQTRLAVGRSLIVNLAILHLQTREM